MPNTWILHNVDYNIKKLLFHVMAYAAKKLCMLKLCIGAYKEIHRLQNCHKLLNLFIYAFNYTWTQNRPQLNHRAV